MPSSAAISRLLPRSPDVGATPAVLCTGVVKRFYRYEHRTTSLREFFIRTVLRRAIHVRRPEFTLRGIDLRVERGESMALIGSNGSGKTTTLRLMAGVYTPSEGVVETWGRVATVVELGAGFHPELTGLENVALYGAVLGLTRNQVKERMPEILDFADIGDFIETPVKFYSSGMHARLAFAVAVSVDPDILLLDEVLAVGDHEFQTRCLERLRTFTAGGGTLITVTHNLTVARDLCERGVWIERGAIRMDGPIHDVVEAYVGPQG